MRRDPTEFRKRFAAYKNGKPIKEIYDGGYIKEPVITPDLQYNEYLNSLPDNQRLTPESSYRSRRYWELNGKPKNFSEAIGKGMFNFDFSDMGWHANSVALDEKTGEYEFMKPNWHNTKMYEDAWYYSKDGEDFRNKYTKKAGQAYDKYIPKFGEGKPTQVGEYNVYPSAIGASELNVTTPDIVVTGKDRRPAWKRMYLNPRLGSTSQYYNRDAIRSITDWTPGIGDVSQGFDAYHAAKNGNYREAAMLGGLLLLPNIIETPLKIAGKTIRKNIKNITPSEWTAAQDAAIARGDIAEAQRLRDLHFMTKTPNNKLIKESGEPFVMKHYGNKWTEFDPNKTMDGVLWNADENAFKLDEIDTFEKEGLPTEWKNLLINMEKPVYDEVTNYTAKLLSRAREGSKEAAEELFKTYGVSNPDGLVKKIKITEDAFAKHGLDVSAEELQHLKEIGIYGKEAAMSVAPYPNKIKLANAVTYDDKGVRIPLGKRDNFNINDIRYGLLPFLGIGAGYGLYNQQQ